MVSSTSPRLAQVTSPESVPKTQESLESVASKARLSPSSQRNPRRSNSAMSSSRTRASAGKDESESEQVGNGEDLRMTMETAVAEPEEEEAAEEQAGSGESSQSAPRTSARARRAGGGKRAKSSGSRARGSKEAQPAVQETEGTEGEGEATRIKTEGDEEVRLEGEEGGSGMSRSDSGEGDKHERQRSASGFKELAGLGLKSLGDGEEEPLVPRRTRRGAASPHDGTQRKEEEDGEVEEESNEEEGKAKGDQIPVAEENVAHADNDIGTGEEEPTEEGVTRCLCGSADENVGLMIQCETCKCWQHCICMGMRTEEDCPDVYFCEQCRPELHIALLRLLGVLPSSRQVKKGNGSKPQSGRVSAKDAAKELKEAKEAVLTLAKENEKRRKDGREPVTGWSVAQEQEQQRQQPQLQHQLQQHPGGAKPLPGGAHKRQPSEAQMRSSRSQSRDEIAVPRSPPKRRSTMNSRDSAYGWEAIPPGLLNEEEEWAAREDSEGGMRKRKRGGLTDDGDRQSASPPDPSSDNHPKRRRTSSAMDAVEDGLQEGAGEEEQGEEEGAASAAPPTTVATSMPNSQTIKSKSKAKPSREQESTRPKHPNQYTARRAAAAAAAAAAAGAGVASSSSPSPSPSKHRMADGSRRTTTLRDVVNNNSRMATPTPNGSQNDYSKLTNPGASWGMPEHLSHLAFLLPSSTGPEPLKVDVASTKGMPASSSSKAGSTSTAIKDAKTDRIVQASPQPFQLISLSEPNTKIKFPGKRTTMGEMKKRVRNILDFVSRLQIESAERERRMRFLGISNETKRAAEGEKEDERENGSVETVKAVEEGQEAGSTDFTAIDAPAQTGEPTAAAAEEGGDTEMKEVDNGEEQQDEGSKDGETHPPNDPTADSAAAREEADAGSVPASSQPPVPDSTSSPALTAAAATNPSSSLKRFSELHSTSMSLVDELTRELLSFQQRYGSGSSSSALMASSSSAY